MPVAEAGADAALFAEALFFDGLLRLAVLPGPLPEHALEEAERALAALALIEDRREEAGGGHGGSDPVLRRLEAKLDLVMILLVRAMPALASLRLCPVRFGAQGLRIEGLVAATDHGVLHWQASDAWPSTLALPVRCLGREGLNTWWQFEPLPPALHEALERHVFRRHRQWRASHRA
jgi:hypothetical protein